MRTTKIQNGGFFAHPLSDDAYHTEFVSCRTDFLKFFQWGRGIGSGARWKIPLFFFNPFLSVIRK